MSQIIPTRAWALVEPDRDALEIFDARLPLFWIRQVAAQYNAERLDGKARIVRASIDLSSRKKRP